MYVLYTGADVSRIKSKDSGQLLSDTIVRLLDHWRAFVPDGLRGVGYDVTHNDALVKGTLPQRKVIDVSPRQPSPDDLHRLLTDSLTLF